MSVLRYLVLVRTMPPEVTEIPGGQEAIKRQLAEMAPLTRKEGRLMVIALLLKAHAGNPVLNTVGLTLIIHFTVCFGFILLVNAAQTMVAYSTGTFEARDFRRTGIPLAILAYLTVLLPSTTYWKWIGLITR